LPCKRRLPQCRSSRYSSALFWPSTIPVASMTRRALCWFPASLGPLESTAGMVAAPVFDRFFSDAHGNFLLRKSSIQYFPDRRKVQCPQCEFGRLVFPQFLPRHGNSDRSADSIREKFPPKFDGGADFRIFFRGSSRQTEIVRLFPLPLFRVLRCISSWKTCFEENSKIFIGKIRRESSKIPVGMNSGRSGPRAVARSLSHRANA